MASALPGSKGLRNRHGSLANIDFRSDEYPPRGTSLQAQAQRDYTSNPSSNTTGAGTASSSSTYMPEPHPRLSLGGVRDWSPATVENGNAIKTLHPHEEAPLSPPLTPSGSSSPPSIGLNGKLAAHGGGAANVTAASPPQAPAPTWRNMPNKGQLAILAASRFVDFFQMAAIQTFMVHQLKSFDETLPDSVISHQAGVLQGAFTASQIITSVLWGRAADQPYIGRKLVLEIGLYGTALGCIGVAFSKSYGQAVFWRLVSGAINGTVGSARTMVAEATPKPWHPRAFLLLPAAFNFANVLGPILAGMLVDPVNSLPAWFGPGSTFGGSNGVGWMARYPFALANLISTVLLFAEGVIVQVFLHETLKGKVPLKMSGFRPMETIRGLYSHFVTARKGRYRSIHQSQREGLLTSNDRTSIELDSMNARGQRVEEKPVQRLPFRLIWTSNVLWVLLTIAVFDFHMGAFANLWILFLATPRRFVPKSQRPLAGNLQGGGGDGGGHVQRLAREIQTHIIEARGVFKFYGGLAFPPQTIGKAMAIIGFIGVALQFILYPWGNARYGLMRCFRASLFLFPAAYYLAPYLALLPSTTPPPGPSSGAIIWIGISCVLFLQVAARTFALPASIILLNNSSPHPSVLGTIHGVGQACSATFRTLGPMLAGYWYGTWTDRGVVGMAWWIVGSVAATGCVASFWVRNGSGHELFLPGEEQELKEAEAGGSGDGR